jgi:hypothetical protein
MVSIPKLRGPNDEYRNFRSGALFIIVALLRTVANPLTGELGFGSGKFDE